MKHCKECGSIKGTPHAFKCGYREDSDARFLRGLADLFGVMATFFSGSDLEIDVERKEKMKAQELRLKAIADRLDSD